MRKGGNLRSNNELSLKVKLVFLLPAVSHERLESTEFQYGRTLLSFYNPFPDQQKSTSETFFEMCITSHTCFHFEYPIQVWEDFWGCFINFEFMCPSLTMSSSFLTLMIHLSDLGCKVFFLHFSLLCV